MLEALQKTRHQHYIEEFALLSKVSEKPEFQMISSFEKFLFQVRNFHASSMYSFMNTFFKSLLSI